jgi:putative NADPH-quinone reductase
MNKLLIMYGGPVEEQGARALGGQYAQGAAESGAVVRTLAITDLKFSPVAPLGARTMDLEPDLAWALEQVQWADHVAFFCSVSQDTIPSRLKGFFDRLFTPDKLFGAGSDFTGRSARIVSVLDKAAWAWWQETKLPAYHSIKRVVFEHRGFRPVRTSTVGYLQALDNEYAKKWLGKMTEFGRKLI